MGLKPRSWDSTLSAVIDQAIEEYKKIRPDWKPPYPTIFRLARAQGLTVTINGFTEAEWGPMIKLIFEDARPEDCPDKALEDCPFEVQAVVGGARELLYWTDLRTISRSRPR